MSIDEYVEIFALLCLCFIVLIINLIVFDVIRETVQQAIKYYYKLRGYQTFKIRVTHFHSAFEKSLTKTLILSDKSDYEILESCFAIIDTFGQEGQFYYFDPIDSNLCEVEDTEAGYIIRFDDLLIIDAVRQHN